MPMLWFVWAVLLGYAVAATITAGVQMDWRWLVVAFIAAMASFIPLFMLP